MEKGDQSQAALVQQILDLQERILQQQEELKSELALQEEFKSALQVQKKEKKPLVMAPVLEKDFFGPRDPSCMRLPKKFKVNFVDSEENIWLLEDLYGSSFIGMDAEWKPTSKACRPAILQLSNEQQAFIVDFMSLANSALLDQTLINIFLQHETVCIGFSFREDLRNFAKHFPAMNFFRKFQRFIDLQVYYQKVIEAGQVGLKTVVENLL